MWEWYSKAAKVRRKEYGIPQKLTPYELRGWAEVTGEIIRPEEYQALLEMDATYITALGAELDAQWQRENPQRGKNGN